jgi:hypothetical protein
MLTTVVILSEAKNLFVGKLMMLCETKEISEKRFFSRTSHAKGGSASGTTSE